MVMMITVVMEGILLRDVIMKAIIKIMNATIATAIDITINVNGKV